MKDTRCEVDSLGRAYGLTTRERISFNSEINVFGCWIWGKSLKDGYGVIKVSGRTRPAHVVSYEEHVGPVPGGMQLDHRCRVRQCVNPDHLEPVTQLENVDRGKLGEQRRRGTCARGHSLAQYGETRTSRGRETTRCGECRRERQRRYYAEGRPHRGSKRRT